jgi:hypothetical protein
MTTGNDDTPSVPPGSATPPDVITWQLNNAAKLGAAAAGFARQVQQYNTRIAELQARADQVRAEAEKALTELANTIADLTDSRDQLAGKRAKELGERDVALRMVALWWQEAHGPDAPLPPIPDEAPADATGPFPAVSLNGATQVIPAVPYSSFNKELLTWTDGRYAVEVTPNLIDRYEGTWRWTGGVNHLDVPLYESLDEERRPVALRWLIDEKGPLTYSDGRTVEPAEVSDQVTATPAQAEAVRSDG